MRKKAIVMWLFLLPFFIQGQELLCDVLVNTPPSFRNSYIQHKELESAVKEFINNTQWTDEGSIDQHEQIQCSFIFDIQEFENNKFNVSMNVKAFRPVYNSIYESQILNFSENISFNFQPNTVLTYTSFATNTPIVSILSFYALIIIGFDYDSFVELGGTPYFNQAEQLFNMSFSAGYDGWNRDGEDNKFRLVQELRAPFYHTFRKAYYAYHRLGLDVLQKDPALGYQKIVEMIKAMETIFKTDQDTYLIDFFFYSKFNEVFNLITNPQVKDRIKLLSVIKKISPYYYGKWKVNQELEKEDKR